jgi:hypothetical protein
MLEYAGWVHPEYTPGNTLPSWCPDWQAMSMWPGRPYVYVPNDLFNANQGFGSAGQVEIFKHTMTAIGAEVDRLQEVLTGSPSELNAMEFLFKTDTRNILNNILGKPPTQHLYKSGIPLVTAVLKMFVRDEQTWNDTSARLDMNDPNFAHLAITFLLHISRVASASRDQPKNVIVDGLMSESDALQLAKDVFDIGRTRTYTWDEISSAIDAEVSTDHWEYDMAQVVNVSTWCLFPFYTQSGYMGFAQCGIHPGDLVCILSNSSFPVILRRIGDEDSYIFISLCFVLGLMDGEAFRSLEGDLELRAFRIV